MEKHLYNTHQNVIALTGGMGSGKSAVALLLQDMCGGVYIDADYTCKQLLKPHAAGWRQIKKSFGNQLLNPDKTINRQQLRNMIFNNDKVRLHINQILHPLVRQHIQQKTEELCRTDTLTPIIIEVPLLFEAHWHDDFTKIITVYAEHKQCIARMVKRDHITRQEAETAISCQMPLTDKIMLADHIIDNSGHWAATYLQILHLESVVTAQLHPIFARSGRLT